MGPSYKLRGRCAYYEVADLDRWSNLHQLRLTNGAMPPTNARGPEQVGEART